MFAMPSAAIACSADVELVKSETGGTDVLHTFRITKDGPGTGTVSFRATTEYLHRGKVFRRASNYSEEVSENLKVVEKPERTQFDIDEIASVKIEDIRCVP